MTESKIMYYPQYVPEEGRRYVREYDTKHGLRIFKHHYGHDEIFIYNNGILISSIFDTLEDALRSWGEYSRRPVTLPSGEVVTPIVYFGHNKAEDVFVRWYPGVTELWPGDEGY